ncbi:calcium-binding protein CML42-like [Rhodamnia argentea]|uniref:Calcium-binding protein CML42-like n=1 Tax=Rhodamnia argentea TaxID=178133 RepID=A0A8B8QA19_9MYRT|nr:calcium-binding protein CML42-like [Rhodamnia argentea]
MEVAASTRLGSSSSSSSSPLAMACGRSLSKKSASFRLHSPSLNSLRLRRIFDLFDKNGDGVITAGELGHALTSLGLDASPTEVDSAVLSFVKPGSTGLEFDDFVLLHRSLDDIFPAPHENGDNDSGGNSSSPSSSSSQDESDLSEAFKVFDEDGDGFISATELQTVLGKLGLSEGQEIARVRQMIVSVDRNRDGLVDFFEFKDMMRGVIATIGS